MTSQLRVLQAFLLLFVSFLANAQLKEDCYPNCNHRSIAGAQGANYYQNNKMNGYDLKYLKLDVTVQPLSRFVSGNCTYNAFVKAPLDTFVMEFKQTMTLDSVYVNNTKRTFTRSSDHVYIPVNAAAGSTLRVTYFYNGTASSSALFSGTVTATGLQFTASLSEAYQAREWFPAKQLLTDKIDSCDLWFTTNSLYKVGSNGVLKQVVDLGSNKQYRWATRYPINYYLPCFSVANYMEYSNYAKPVMLPNDSILNLHYIVNNTSYFTTNKANIDKTPRFVEKFSELYGLYPFYKEKYGHIQASIGGGMEHQTMSTMENFGTSLIAHELAHQWWGDAVTCATWNDIWINEGFASYGEYLTMQYLPALSTTTAAAKMDAVHTSVMSATGGSVYVPQVDAYNESRIFSGRLSYDKGSAIIHNLRFEMQSDTLFFRTLRTFQQTYKDTFATGDNFRQVAEQVSGRSYADFFDQWYYGQGYPTYSVLFGKQGNDSLTITLSQTSSMPTVTPFFKGLVELKIRSAQGDTTIVVNNSVNNQQYTFLYKKTPSGLEVDPNNWIINKVGSIVTSITNLSAAQAGIRMYPNPTNGQINVSLPATGFKYIRMLDLMGRTIVSYTLPAGTTLFKSNLHVPPGIYLLQVNGTKGNVVERVLVQ